MADLQLKNDGMIWNRFVSGSLEDGVHGVLPELHPHPADGLQQREAMIV